MPYGNLLADVVQSSTVGTPVQFNDGGGTQVGTLCRAWCVFNGSTATVTSSFNVSSVTRSATGTYLVIFTNAMPDANYSALMGNGGGYNDIGGGTKSTTQVQCYTYNFSNPPASVDRNPVSVAVFR